MMANLVDPIMRCTPYDLLWNLLRLHRRFLAGFSALAPECVKIPESNIFRSMISRYGGQLVSPICVKKSNHLCLGTKSNHLCLGTVILTFLELFVLRFGSNSFCQIIGNLKIN